MKTELFKARLLAEKEKLEEGMVGVGRKNPKVPNDFEAVGSVQGEEADLMDQADVIESFETNEGVLRDLETRYDEVLAALKRIDDGTYGACTVSGEPIEEARLEANPAAATCLAHNH